MVTSKTTAGELTILIHVLLKLFHNQVLATFARSWSRRTRCRLLSLRQFLLQTHHRPGTGFPRPVAFSSTFEPSKSRTSRVKHPCTCSSLASCHHDQGVVAYSIPVPVCPRFHVITITYLPQPNHPAISSIYPLVASWTRTDRASSRLTIKRTSRPIQKSTRIATVD